MTDSGGHPSLDTWEQLACDDLSAQHRRRVMTHLEDCGDCREIWQAVCEVRDAARSFDPALSPPAASRHGAAGRHAWWGLAAAMVSVAAGFLVLKAPQSSPPPEPAAEVERAAPGDTLELISPLEGELFDAATFSWQAIPADHYRIELLDASGTLLWRSGDLDEPRVAWPDSLPRESGGVYYWRVVASQEGRELSSDVVRFELSTDPE